MKLISEHCKESISALASEAERQVRVAMTEEIKRLPTLVDEFQRPFHPNSMVLRVYKAELYKHVEDGMWFKSLKLAFISFSLALRRVFVHISAGRSWLGPFSAMIKIDCSLGLGRNLSARCSTSLQKEIDKNREEMTRDVAPLLLPPSAVLNQESPMDDEPGSSCVDAQSHKMPGTIDSIK